MEKQTYTPVDCGFYDTLELAAMRREYLNMVYRDADGTSVPVKAFIEDLWAKDGEEFMRIHNGAVIRLDHILKIEGHYDLGTDGSQLSCRC